MLGEVLTYLEIKKDNEQEEEKQEVEVPNVVGMTETDAKKTLEEIGLGLEVKEKQENNAENSKNNTDEEKVITEQLPKAGITIKQGTTVIVYKN